MKTLATVVALTLVPSVAHAGDIDVGAQIVLGALLNGLPVAAGVGTAVARATEDEGEHDPVLSVATVAFASLNLLASGIFIGLGAERGDPYFATAGAVHAAVAGTGFVVMAF